MSHDICKYCHGYAFKTDGSGDFVCLTRANTGTCDAEQPDTEAQMKTYVRDHYDTGESIRSLRRADKRKTKGKRKYGYK